MKKVSGLALVQRLLKVLGWTLVVCVAGTGGAAAVTYDMTMQLGNDTLSLASLLSAGLLFSDDNGQSGYYTTLGPITQAGDWQVDSWTSNYNAGGYVYEAFEVTNLSGATQIFSVSVIAPADLFGPGGPDEDPFTYGDQYLTLSSGTADGATLTSALGDPVYTALLDGTEYRTLQEDPYALSCAGTNCSISNNWPLGLEPGPISATSVGLTIQFALSPGASAHLGSLFSLIQIPEPSTLVLFGGGLAGMALLRLPAQYRGRR